MVVSCVKVTCLTPPAIQLDWLKTGIRLFVISKISLRTAYYIFVTFVHCGLEQAGANICGQITFLKCSPAALICCSHCQTLTAGADKTGNGASSSINLSESWLNFYHFFLDSEKAFWRSQGWREADKCQRLIAKLRTEQRGSGETKQRKWHSVVETLSYSDSYHSGHHELMPGCLMQASEPKEHLSVTSAISVCEGSAAAAARPCQSCSGAASWQMESFLLALWMSYVWFGMSVQLF